MFIKLTITPQRTTARVHSLKLIYFKNTNTVCHKSKTMINIEVIII
jgi:hypothetical protein